MKFKCFRRTAQTKPVDVAKRDWDTWHKEHPMDYIAGLALIEQAHAPEDKDALFMDLFRGWQSYVPNTLFKYYSLGNDADLKAKKLKTLSEGKVYLSRISDFNDPFDCKGFYYHPSRLQDVPRLQNRADAVLGNYTEMYLSTCFTENGVNSMPMWAHYGGNHSGFCVSYDMQQNPELKPFLFPIQYTEARLDVTGILRRQFLSISNLIEQNIAAGILETSYSDLTLIYLLQMLANIKHSSWSYEKEFRCTLGQKPGMEPYAKAQPSAIYAGMNCAPEDVQQLVEIGKKLNVPVFKMTFDECSEEYKLVAKRIC